MKVTITILTDAGQTVVHEADGLQPTQFKMQDPLREADPKADWEWWGFTYQPHVVRKMKIR